MRYNSLPIGLRLSAAVLLAAAGAGAAWASPTDPPNPLTKRFVQGKALDVCDFGALFIGGVPKVTNYLNWRLPLGLQIKPSSARCMCSSRFPLSAVSGLSSWSTGPVTQGQRSTPHQMEGKVGSPMRYKTIWPRSWPISQDADAPALTNPCFMRQESRITWL